MKLILRDLDSDVVLALVEAFGPLDDVSVGVGDLALAEVDALLLPIQSWDPLDGGLARRLHGRFGARPWARLKALSEQKFGGSVPVGEALMVSTGQDRLRWLIAAPPRSSPQWIAQRWATKDDYGRIRNPGFQQSNWPGVPPFVGDEGRLVSVMGLQVGGGPAPPDAEPGEGAFRALSAALRVAAAEPGIRRLGAPGLGTGAAGGDPWVVAAAMARAWVAWRSAG